MPISKCLGKDLYYEIHGEKGEYLLVLNGMLMTTRAWLSVLPSLAEHYRVILLDMVDQGQSEKMTEAYSNAFQADVVKVLLDNLGVEQTYVTGTSYGGTVALLLALHYPEKVKKMFLFSTGGGFANSDSGDVIDGWRAAAQSYDLDTYFDAVNPYVYAPKFFERHGAAISAGKELLRPFVTEAYFEAVIRLGDSVRNHYDLSGKTEQITCPVLIAAGEFDQLLAVDELRTLAQMLPDGHFVIIPEAGHVSIFEQPAVVLALMLGWFREIQFVKLF
ncbi:MAG: alpha/beta hydrolase [Oscillospiraceae bacterium]|nr:alpha/beta hydrolase [Oscillospiraceae bacterium]